MCCRIKEKQLQSDRYDKSDSFLPHISCACIYFEFTIISVISDTTRKNSRKIKILECQV